MDDFYDTTKALQQDLKVNFFKCINGGCGKKCSSTDEGVNEFMKYCNACNIILNATLAGVDEPSSAAGVDEPSVAGVDEPSSADSGESPVEIPKTLQDIREALSALVRARDPTQCAVIYLGKSVNLLYFIGLNSNISFVFI